MTVKSLGDPFFYACRIDKRVLMEKKLQIQIPEKLLFLINRSMRYKCAWGGRGGYKSWSFALGLIIKAMEKKVRILCVRETQKSIEDSVHALLSDQIERLGLCDEFEVLKTSIRNKVTGSTFIFDGIRDSTIDIKGKENIDYCWLEEAEKTSKESWQKLYPTIRKEGSEIWVSFNTTNEDAFIYQRFVMNPPENSIVVKTYWYENPFCTETTRKDALDCKKNDPQGYKFIWLGEPSNVGGLVYPMFREPVHVRRFLWDYIANVGNCFVGMDPHKTAYPAVVFGCKFPINEECTEFNYVIYNEFPSKNMLGGKLYYEVRKTARCAYTQKQLTGMFSVLENTVYDRPFKNLKIYGRAADPYFSKGVGGGDWSSNTEGLVNEWARPENGGVLWTLPDSKLLSAQKNTINTLLDFNDEVEISAINDAHLFVLPHCQNTITTLKYHRTSDDKEIEDEKHKDFSDALRILMAVMYYTPYVNPQKKNTDSMLLTIGQQLRPLFFTTARD